MFRGLLWAVVLCGAEPSFAKTVIGGLERVVVKAEAASGGTVHLPYEVRVDTGATETSLDAIEIKKVSKGGVAYVQFRTRSAGTVYDLQAPFVKQGRVRSSNGISQVRHFVKLELCLGSQRISTVVSLADRQSMRQPILIGRTLLHGRYLVDVDKDHVLGDPECE